MFKFRSLALFIPPGSEQTLPYVSQNHQHPIIIRLTRILLTIKLHHRFRKYSTACPISTSG